MALLRIVGVQRAGPPGGEFVLLQNQGGLKAHLRGHCVVDEQVFNGGLASGASHVFSDDIWIPPGMYVILYSGSGDARWCRSKDGAMLYHAYMGRKNAVWAGAEGPIHVLAPVHTFNERREILELAYTVG